jgi:hypothetical protein
MYLTEHKSKWRIYRFIEMTFPCLSLTNKVATGLSSVNLFTIMRHIKDSSSNLSNGKSTIKWYTCLCVV